MSVHLIGARVALLALSLKHLCVFKGLCVTGKIDAHMRACTRLNGQRATQGDLCGVKEATLMFPLMFPSLAPLDNFNY